MYTFNVNIPNLLKLWDRCMILWHWDINAYSTHPSYIIVALQKKLYGLCLLYEVCKLESEMSSKLVFFYRLWKHRKLSRPWTWPVNMSLNMNYITYYLRFINPSYICAISTQTKQIKCNNFTFVSSLSPLLFASII